MNSSWAYDRRKGHLFRRSYGEVVPLLVRRPCEHLRQVPGASNSVAPVQAYNRKSRLYESSNFKEMKNAEIADRQRFNADPDPSF